MKNVHDPLLKIWAAIAEGRTVEEEKRTYVERRVGSVARACEMTAAEVREILGECDRNSAEGNFTGVIGREAFVAVELVDMVGLRRVVGT